MLDVSSNTSRRRSDSQSASEEEKSADIERNPLSHTRSSSPAVTGRNPIESRYTAEPARNRSDGKNQKTDDALPGFENGASEKPKNRVKDPRKDVRVVRVDGFHLFYWLAATPTATTNKDRSAPTSGEERDRREGISFTLDNRNLRQCIAQIQTYLKKKNKTSQHAYAQCPSKSLEEVEAFAANFNSGKSENLQELEQAIHHLKKVEQEYQRAKRMEETAQPDSERMMRKIKVLELEEECRLAKQKLDDLGVTHYTDKQREENLEPGIEMETKEEDYNPYPSKSQEGEGKARSGSRASSSLAGSSPKSKFYEIHSTTNRMKRRSKSPKTILKLSKQLFAFFFPLTHSSNMTDKYWGGVFRLLLHVGIVLSLALPHADTLN